MKLCCRLRRAWSCAVLGLGVAPHVTSGNVRPVSTRVWRMSRAMAGWAGRPLGSSCERCRMATDRIALPGSCRLGNAQVRRSATANDATRGISRRLRRR